MNFRYLLSRRLEEYIIENMPNSRELSLAEFLTEEAIEKFGIRARIFDNNNSWKVRYKFMPEVPKVISNKVKINKINKEDKINLIYLKSGIEIDILNNSSLYAPDFRFTHKLFILLNKILGFKQEDFRNYFTKILNTPERVVIMPVILNSADFCGKTMYMFEGEAREYLNFYYNKVKEHFHILEIAKNGNSKNGKCEHCANSGFPFAYFSNCDKCPVLAD